MTDLWPLPALPHVPGRTPRPLESPAFDAAAAAPIYTVDRMWRENATYLYGLKLYAAGFFWEASEVWEPVWIRSPASSRERLLIQGLIQLSSGCLKIVMGRTAAARRLLEISHEKIAQASDDAEAMMGQRPIELSDSILQFKARIFANPKHNVDKLLRRRPTLSDAETAIVAA